MSPKDQIDSFIATHLEPLCDEYIAWSNTGVLYDGAMRILADKIQGFYPMDAAMALFDAKTRLGDFLIHQKHGEFMFDAEYKND